MKNTVKVIGFIDLSKFDEPKPIKFIPKKEDRTNVSTCIMCGRIKHTSECVCEIDY